MWSTPSLPLFPGPLWHGVVAADRVLFMSQIEQTMCKQMTDVETWLLKSLKPFNWVQKKSAGSFKNDFYKMCLQIVYIFNIYIYIKKIWH